MEHLQPANILRLILGDQLNINHSWFSSPDPEVMYVIMEVYPETTYTLHHIQKLLAVLGAMELFAQTLVSKGHRVTYLYLNDSSNTQTFLGNITNLLQVTGAQTLEYQEPDEYRLRSQLTRELQELAINQNITCNLWSTEHFLSTKEDFQSNNPQKPPIMEQFYRAMRKKTGFLMESTFKGPQPLGGRWNYDQENRSKWKGDPPAPKIPRFAHHRPLLERVYERLVTKQIPWFGNVEISTWQWPLTRQEALLMLEDFIQHRLPWFGTYQDALEESEPYLFHSLLSFSLNMKLINPREVIEQAISFYQAHPGTVPLAGLEGFVRQILGWREYMYQFYWWAMPDFAKTNYFQAHRQLPAWYWTGETKMACCGRAVTNSLNNSYAHHIQRLMITGNFALMAGIDPDQVDSWYLGIYIDAFDWVERPNTRGMSQFADGGLVATKPYSASASYIQKMGGPCTSCWYDPKKRTGERACPFNSLYWDFIARNKDLLSGNHRMAIPLSSWNKFSPQDQAAIRDQARYYLEHLDEL
jgi:deoxyribodipyrimidine photolyase-related protein